MFNTQLTNQGAPGSNPMYMNPGQFQYPMGPAMNQPGFFNMPFGRTAQNTQIHVSDFEDTMNGSILFDYFQRYGRIVNFVFPISQTTKRSRGFAFITYQTPNEAQTAIEKANHTQVLIKTIRVSMFKPNFKDIPKEANLFVSNLTDEIKEKDIEDWFKENQIGGVISCKILYENGKTKGYGYFQLDSVKSCDEFLQNNSSINIKGQEILFQRFTPKNQRPTPKNNLYIRNLPEPISLSEENVKDVLLEKFSQFGRVSSVLVKQWKDPNTLKSSYFAFVCFQDEGEQKATIAAQSALEQLKGCDIFGNGVGIEVVYFEKKAERMKKNLLNNIYTKNLKENVKESDVYKVFQEFGPITRYTVKAPQNIKTKYAIIQFANKEDASAALYTAFKKKEVKDLYCSEEVQINPLQDREARKKIKEAKFNASSFNKHLSPPTEQISYPIQNPAMQMYPQAMYGPQQMLGAPTIGINNPINQSTGSFNNFSGYSQQFGINQNMIRPNSYQQPPQQQQTGYNIANRQKNMYINKGKPVRVPPQQNKPISYPNNMVI